MSSKRKRDYHKFIDIKAESSDSGEIDSDVESEDFEGYFEQNDVLHTKNVTTTYDDKLKEIEKKYIEEESEDDEESDYYDKVAEAAPQVALLATSGSPLLFLVKCKIGRVIFM